MSASTAAKDGDPSDYVTVYVSRRQAETMEQHFAELSAETRWESGLRALRRALGRNAGTKRYPWQKEKS